MPAPVRGGGLRLQHPGLLEQDQNGGDDQKLEDDAGQSGDEGRREEDLEGVGPGAEDERIHHAVHHAARQHGGDQLDVHRGGAAPEADELAHEAGH